MVIPVSSLSANAVLLLSYIVPLESHTRPVILVTGLERYFSMSVFYLLFNRSNADDSMKIIETGPEKDRRKVQSVRGRRL